MWRDFQNLVETLRHYRVMSPDRAVRRQVNEHLKLRPCLSADDWCQHCWHQSSAPCVIMPPLARFLYVQLGEYSGLQMGYTRPSDRLQEDLCFPLVCWFDWGMMLCEDVYQTFDVDISDSFDERDYVTLADLAGYLDGQIKTKGASSA